MCYIKINRFSMHERSKIFHHISTCQVLLLQNLHKKAHFPVKTNFRQFSDFSSVMLSEISCALYSLLIFFFWMGHTHSRRYIIPPLFWVNNRLSLFILLPSSVPPSPAFPFLVLLVSGSAPHNIRGSPVICDPSNPHLILLKRGSIQFTAWRAPNRPSLLWQVSTLANNWSPVPCPPYPSATLNQNYLRLAERSHIMGNMEGRRGEGEDKGEITFSDSY